jgi:hypothetical protein
MAVYGLGALDQVAELVDALANPKGDVRDVAVIALRHWIGRKQGQDLKLYNVLTKEKNFTPNQAAILVQLLHSFGDVQQSQPATYETLIDYLMHDKPAIRQLAYWHLVRLAPSGKDIKFDPNASAEARQSAVEQWKKVIPAGQLPNSVEKKDK